MKQIYFFISLTFISFLTQAQNKLKANSAYKIVYWRSADGKPVEDRNAAVVIVAEHQNLITSANILDGKTKYPFEQSLVLKPENLLFQIADLNQDYQISTTDSTAISKQIFEFSNETKNILGYTCKKAKTIVNSNTIELWFTTDAGIKAAPTNLGQNLGLVLEQVRNGNSFITATKIEEVKNVKSIDLEKIKSKYKRQNQISKFPISNFQKKSAQHTNI